MVWIKVKGAIKVEILGRKRINILLTILQLQGVEVHYTPRLTGIKRPSHIEMHRARQYNYVQK